MIHMHTSYRRLVMQSVPHDKLNSQHLFWNKSESSEGTQCLVFVLLYLMLKTIIASY